MLRTHMRHWRMADIVKILCLAAVLVTPGLVFADDLTDHMSDKQHKEAIQKSEKEGLSPGHRHIEGVVETVHEDTIRVNTDETGGLAPRYLNLNKVNNDENIKLGDTLQIEVNAQNKVVKYQKIP
jgi:hypothetical protein